MKEVRVIAHARPSLANVVLLALSDCNLPNGKHTERA